MHFRVDSYDSAKNAISRTLELIFSNVGSIQFDPFDVNELSFDCKYGVDGAQSRSNLTHHFQVEGRSDSNLVLVAMVPLSLSFQDKNIWFNKKPNSINFTRPVFFIYEKESSKLIKNIIESINNSLLRSDIFEINLDNTFFKFKLNIKFKWTMTDGKVVNYATDNTATLRCNICKKTFRDFKDDLPTFDPISDKIADFGIAPLHSKLKIFDYLLNLSRKNNIKIFMNESNIELSPKKVKEIETKFKNSYIENFWEKGAIVDRVKVGYGTSNTGPMVDKLFKDPNFISATLNIDLGLVEDFIKISELLNSKDKIDLTVYMELANNCIKILRSKYSFISIYPHIHKILVHGPSIIQILQAWDFRPGVFPEQSQEGLNKQIRIIRGC